MSEIVAKNFNSGPDQTSPSETGTTTIDIAMSVYNGEKWLVEMLDSLAAQTATNWRLVVWNDGSTDNTANILLEWTSCYPHLVTIVPNPENINLGIAGGFTKALEACTAPYIMLADADDIWLPDKVEISYQKLLQAEKTFGSEIPRLLHTDITVIDEFKNVLFQSYGSRLKSDQGKLNRFMFEPLVTSPTIIMNRQVVDLSLPIPSELGLQDWWLALVTCAFGEITFLPRQTMLYRRHGNNDSVWLTTTIRGRIGRIVQAFLNPVAVRERIYELQAKSFLISKLFYERYHNYMSIEQRKMFYEYINIRNLPFWKRRLVIIRYGLWFRLIMPDIGLFLLI